MDVGHDFLADLSLELGVNYLLKTTSSLDGVGLGDLVSKLIVRNSLFGSFSSGFFGQLKNVVLIEDKRLSWLRDLIRIWIMSLENAKTLYSSHGTVLHIVHLHLLVSVADLSKQILFDRILNSLEVGQFSTATAAATPGPVIPVAVSSILIPILHSTLWCKAEKVIIILLFVLDFHVGVFDDSCHESPDEHSADSSHREPEDDPDEEAHVVDAHCGITQSVGDLGPEDEHGSSREGATPHSHVIENSHTEDNKADHKG